MDADTFRYLLVFTFGKVEDCPRVRRVRVKTMFFAEAFCKGHGRLILAVNNEHLRRFLGRKALDPVDEPCLVSMTREALQDLDLGTDRDRLPENPDFIGAVDNSPAGCSDRLVADKKNGALRTPQVVFQVMLDAARITHAGCRDDDLRLVIRIDCLRLIRRDRQIQTVELQRIDALSDKFHCLVIIALRTLFTEDLRRLNGKRGINIHREIRQLRDQVLFLDLTDEVQHFLCPAYGKTRYNQVSSAKECFLDNCGEVFLVIALRRFMQPVAVGRLHDHIVCRVRVLRILQKRLIFVSDITGKYDFLRDRAFRRADRAARRSTVCILCKPELDARGPEQVSDIRETELHSVAQLIFLPVAIPLKQPQAGESILHRVGWLNLLPDAGAGTLFVLPFRFLLLNMRTVTQHDVAQCLR